MFLNRAPFPLACFRSCFKERKKGNPTSGQVVDMRVQCGEVVQHTVPKNGFFGGIKTHSGQTFENLSRPCQFRRIFFYLSVCLFVCLLESF